MQTVARLNGNQMQRPLFGLRRAQPLDRRLPLRMRCKIRIAVAGDFLAEQLDFAAWGLQRIGLRIGTEAVEEHKFLRRCRQFHITFTPEIRELRPLDASTRLRLPALLID
ncbi:hypothetical protein D3C79_948650 [compost metagenome]